MNISDTRTFEISDLLITTTDILKQITRDLADSGDSPYSVEEELECVRTCESNLMTVKLLMNFNAVWLTETEESQLDLACRMAKTIALILKVELDEEEDDYEDEYEDD